MSRKRINPKKIKKKKKEHSSTSFLHTFLVKIESSSTISFSFSVFLLHESTLFSLVLDERDVRINRKRKWVCFRDLFQRGERGQRKKRRTGGRVKERDRKFSVHGDGGGFARRNGAEHFGPVNSSKTNGYRLRRLATLPCTPNLNPLGDGVDGDATIGLFGMQLFREMREAIDQANEAVERDSSIALCIPPKSSATSSDRTTHQTNPDPMIPAQSNRS
ncbi:hypothetical protein NE237_020449 [Protea cynaroides]|uniref:Uncharacterized protein n=1 Tax=Protea cynaroides TaxID=273540 RepID=A0A9Q0H7A2_9MAGN|nr:hypothetical protein NE237_020449 [Protea cynaroides]